LQTPSKEMTLYKTARASFERIEINKAIPRDVFDVSIPIGASVTDEPNNKNYVMGPDGKPAGGVAPIPRPQPNPAQPSYREEKGSGKKVLLLIGLPLVAGTVSSYFYFRYRRRVGKCASSDSF
jgi:hypothetical protein